MNEDLHVQYQKLLNLLKAASETRLLHLEPALEEAARFFELVAEEVEEAPEAKKEDLQQMITNIEQVLKEASSGSQAKGERPQQAPQRDEERIRKALARMLKASGKIKKAFGEEPGVFKEPSKAPSSKKEGNHPGRPRREKKGWMKS